jgi:hypothetical protein
LGECPLELFVANQTAAYGGVWCDIRHTLGLGPTTHVGPKKIPPSLRPPRPLPFLLSNAVETSPEVGGGRGTINKKFMIRLEKNAKYLVRAQNLKKKKRGKPPPRLAAQH